MSLNRVSQSDTDTSDRLEDGTASARTRLLPPIVMLAVVGIAAALPLLRNTIFFYWDDTAAATVPVWRRIAEAVLDGRLPLMEPDLWRGGGYAAEASTGIFNPLMVLLAVVTYAIDNMALAITVAKASFLLLMAGGTYLLAREYGVRPWLAAAAGTAIPLATQTFYWDGSSWMYSLMATAFTPWVWWTLRRATHRGKSLLWVVVAGYLCCSLGNPYGFMATGILVLGFAIEAWVNGRRGRAVGIALSGVSVATLNVIVYLPLVLTSSVGYRSESRTNNDDFLSPSLTDLLGMSTPTTEPWIWGFHLPHLTIPATYLAWFVLPMLPWLRWRVLRDRGRSLVALCVFAGFFTLMTLGPSQIWMFRWPLRLITSLWFPVILLWVIVANAGLERTKVRMRAAMSAGVIFLGAWLAWSDIPQNIGRIFVGSAMVAVLVALLVWRGVRTRSGAAVLIVGTLSVLAMQLQIYPSMDGVNNYRFPTSQQQLRERFAKYDGLTVQIADYGVVDPSDLNPARAYQDMLFGSMYSAAGVESTTAYSGIGYTKMDSTLCMVYQGSVCPRAWETLWRPIDGYSVPLADLMRVRTVVVQNKLIDTRDSAPPRGWRRAPEAEASGLVTVWKRIDPLPWPNGRVSNASQGVRVQDDRSTDTTGEEARFTRDNSSGPGELTFARLNWPGYTATVNGKPTTLRTNSAGLLVVDLPAGTASGTVQLSWQVPGAMLGASSAAFGLLLAIGLGIVPALTRRRSRLTSGGGAEHTPDTAGDGEHGGGRNGDAREVHIATPAHTS